MYSAEKVDLLGPSALIASLCVALAFVPPSVVQHLTWDRDAIDAGELWRLWTGHFVHYSLHHALLDSATVALLGWMAEVHFGKYRIAATFLLGALLMSLALLLVPGIMEYRGASGLATLLGTLVGMAVWREAPARRVVLTVLVAVFLIKVIGDAFGFPLTLAELPTNVTIAWQAHLLGMGLAAIVFWRVCDKTGAQMVACGYLAQQCRSAPSRQPNLGQHFLKQPPR